MSGVFVLLVVSVCFSLFDWLIPVSHPFCSDYLLASFTVRFDISALTVGYFRSLHFVSVSYRDLSSSVLRIRAIEFCFLWVCRSGPLHSCMIPGSSLCECMIGCCACHTDAIGAAVVYCCCLSPPVNCQYYLSSLWLDA